MGTILDERDDRDANGSSVDTLYVRYDGEALRTHEDGRETARPRPAVAGQGVRHAAKGRRGDPVTAIVNASGLMGIYFGAVGMLKKLARNVKPVKTEAAGKNDDGLDLINVTFSDGSRMCALRASVDALKNPELVKSIQGAISPTLDDGIDLVQFQSGTRDETVNTEDADAISHYDPGERNRTEDTVEIIVQALDVSFRENGKWRITDGIKTQFVTLDDEAFKKRVLDGDEAMRANDIYRVEMRVEKAIDEHNRLATRYISIVKVLEHRSVAEQPTLF